MNNLNRDNILDMHSEQLGFYKTHLNILKILTIILSVMLSINIISGISNGDNIFDIYNNPLLYYAMCSLLIIVTKLWALYNFKKIGIYIIYIINGLIQLMVTDWFVVAIVLSMLAHIIMTILILYIFVSISIANISLIVNYYKQRNLFIY